MDDRIVAIKAEIFDIIEQQERLNLQYNALEEAKKQKANELNKLRAEQEKTPEA